MGHCCLKVTMYFFVFFNHLFIILGALVLAAGLWILFDKYTFIFFRQASPPSFTASVYLIIVVGAITMMMGFLGCVGAFYGIQCLLGLYITCLLLILAAQISAGLLLYLQGNELHAMMAKRVSDVLHHYNPIDETNQTAEIAWDFIQTRLSCCGWTGPENWKNNTVLRENNWKFYPCSCSNVSQIPVGFCPLDTASGSVADDEWPVTTQGCQQMMRKWMQEKLDSILAVCLGVAITEILGMLFSICICKSKTLAG
ncbi:CD82 antigen-like [Elgaria multicarinata webbii]|uniref:CD82 antigen-like n=1 Tax=Elgaria multicarinata webbii TaxID=159646 RepID=UPI002FCD3158